MRCADGTLYTGWTFDLQGRLAVHNSGRGARYTASRLPAELVYWEEAACRSEALRRERAIKKMTRRVKEALFAERNDPTFSAVPPGKAGLSSGE
ncbi:MAG: GIY-YIG nuclease family protein [Synergistaceae bacterium]|nr:GIY-YIG nuclease family protein [Synergistaceae bacterium]